ncbi:uncharacterized protein ColSpa_09729 [Colletotrichum spaethianum]|uniref:Uncharacterized protein n=1 Tax=Colletotrichum spaethianum TaxID=700344 RepID=A0AA37US93_9PEZI|nr:uncharacterized protein ColSpa_09729 [Colletotrichum spaethianum]GKT49548.1 hypothetical protein ColSpa_09729 [Colletotrichum spaethianum]
MATWLPSNGNWGFVQNVTGDASCTPGHGFDGYFETNLGNGSQYLSNPGVMDVPKSYARSIGQDPERLVKMLGSDGNFLGEDRDTTEGLWGLSFHAIEK